MFACRILHVACRMSRAACLHVCMWRVRRFKVPFDTDTQRRRMCRRLDSPGIAPRSTARVRNRRSSPSAQGSSRARQSPRRPGTPAKNNPLSAAVVHVGHPGQETRAARIYPPLGSSCCARPGDSGVVETTALVATRGLCMLLVACRMLHVACCMQVRQRDGGVSRCMLHVACCMLYVASCMLRVAYSQPVIRSR